MWRFSVEMLLFFKSTHQRHASARLPRHQPDCSVHLHTLSLLSVILILGQLPSCSTIDTCHNVQNAWCHVRQQSRAHTHIRPRVSVEGEPAGHGCPILQRKTFRSHTVAVCRHSRHKPSCCLISSGIYSSWAVGGAAEHANIRNPCHRALLLTHQKIDCDCTKQDILLPRHPPWRPTVYRSSLDLPMCPEPCR